MKDFLADLDNELNGNVTEQESVKKGEEDNAAKSVEIKKEFLRNNGKPTTPKKAYVPQAKTTNPNS
jgi:hypothetical protein